MTKELYFNLKNEQKELANQIKSLKPNFKETQRIYSNSKTACPNLLMASTQQILKERGAAEAMYKAQYELNKIKRIFRYQHIVYCIARGRKYSEIEQKVDKSNQIFYNEISRYFQTWEVEVPVELKNEIELAVAV